MYEIIISEDAYNDIEETHDYITNTLNNPIAADRLIEKVFSAIRSLSEPYLYPLSTNIKLFNMGYRKIIVNNYIILYKINENNKTVMVVRFIYARRNYENLF